MANVCIYKIQVKGTQTACYALRNAMPLYEDYEEIISESGTPEDYTLVFGGDCKWSVDAYTTPLKNPQPLTPEQIEAVKYGDYWDCTLKDKSLLFDCEIICASYDQDQDIFMGVQGYSHGARILNPEAPNSILPRKCRGPISDVFEGCKSLTSITIPDSVTKIGSGAFRGCSGLADKNGFVVVHGVLYDYFGSGGDIVIPDSVTEIGQEAFKDCNNLTSITIPDSVTEIGWHAFKGCGDKDGYTIIDNVLYSYTGHDYKVLIPNGVTKIAEGAFFGCSDLFSVTIPNSVTEIGKSAFEGCASLTSIAIPDSVTEIGNRAFWGCGKLTSVTIPNSVTEIGDGAFIYCLKLTDVTLSKGMKTIKKNIFKNCSGLRHITIPAAVEKIETNAFAFCTCLTDVTILGESTKVLKTSFRDCPNVVIHAPAGSAAEKMAKKNEIAFEALA